MCPVVTWRLLTSEEVPLKRGKHKQKGALATVELSRQQKKRAKHDPLEAKTVTQMQEQLMEKAGRYFLICFNPKCIPWSSLLLLYFMHVKQQVVSLEVFFKAIWFFFPKCSSYCKLSNWRLVVCCREEGQEEAGQVVGIHTACIVTTWHRPEAETAAQTAGTTK